MTGIEAMNEARHADHTHQPVDDRDTATARGAGDRSWLKDSQLLDWKEIWSFVLTLRNYFRLFTAILLIAIIFTVVRYAVVKPTFMAVAIVGPPSPSLANSAMPSAGGGVASRLLGGVRSTGTNDPYQDFLQLLPSSRLSQVLIERDHLLDRINHAGQEPREKTNAFGFFKAVKDSIKRFLNRPVAAEANIDKLMAYLNLHLTVNHSTRASTSGPLAGNSPYMEVAFSFEDAQEAESMLNIILSETDRIIRDERRRDVIARVAFLRTELAKQTNAVDERTALIGVLSEQEQLLAMIEADQRYASTLIVPPYASSEPTAPPGPRKALLTVLLVSLLVWIGIVFLSKRLLWIEGWIVRLRCKTPGSTNNHF